MLMTPPSKPTETPSKREWLTWGQCVALFEKAGLNRKIWEAVQSQQPPVIEIRRFPGSKWKRYRATDVRNQL